MDLSDKFIIIYGLPAVGKTTIALACNEVLRNHSVKSYYLSGDKIANISYYCEFSNSELNSKYKNLSDIIMNLQKEKRIVMYDDIFKREQDIKDMVSLAKRCWKEVYAINIVSNLKESLIRDSLRDLNIALGSKRMVEYYKNYKQFFIEDSLVISSDNQSIVDSVQSIFNHCNIAIDFKSGDNIDGSK